MDIRNEVVDMIILKMQNVIDELTLETTAVMSKLETQNKTLIGAVNELNGKSNYELYRERHK